jgi:hypothetical protein
MKIKKFKISDIKVFKVDSKVQYKNKILMGLRNRNNSLRRVDVKA